MYFKEEYLDTNPEVVHKLMETVDSFSELSKCAAKQICCILYKDGNIISIGLNGTAPDTVNCNEKFKKINGVWYRNNNVMGNVVPLWVECENQDEHHYWSLYNEIHAEVNAISKALVPVQGSVAFVNYSPCFNCSKTFVAFGIKKIYYRHRYDDFENVSEFLKSQGVEVIRVDKNGGIYSE